MNKILSFGLVLLLLCSFAFAATDEFHIEGLVNHWPLNDTLYNESGSIVDIVGGIDGQGFGKTSFNAQTSAFIVYNTTELKPGTGNHYSLNGDLEFIGRVIGDSDFLSPLASADSASFCANILFYSTGGSNQAIITSWDDDEESTFHIKGSTNQLQFSFHTTAGTFGDNGPSVLSEGQVYSACAVIDDSASEAYIYLDGELEETISYTGTLDIVNPEDYTIGMRGITNTDWDFNGSVDEVKIWTHALNATEVLAEVNATSPRTSEGLIAYYSFNVEGPTIPFGDLVYDSSHLSIPLRNQIYQEGSPSYTYEPSTSFDRDNDNYVDLEPVTTTNSLLEMTQCALIEKQSSDNIQVILGSGTTSGATSLQVRANNDVRFVWKSSDLSSYALDAGLSLTDGETYVLCGVVDNSTNTGYVYVDGVEENNVSYTGNLDLGDNNLYAIGRRSSSSTTWYFNGSIQDVRIYDQALNADQIKTISEGLVSKSFTAVGNSTNTSIQAFNVTSIYGNDETTNGTAQLYVPYGQILLNWSSGTYYDINDREFNILSSQESYLFEAANAGVVVTADSALSGSSITNFTINIVSSVFPDFNESFSTTNGTVNYNYLIAGEYNVSIDADGYAFDSRLLNISEGANPINFDLYTTNSVLFKIYDEATNNLITSHNMTVELIGAEAESGTTTNGTIYFDDLTPSEYEVRYYSSTNGKYKLRSHWVDVTNRSTQIANLYALDETDTNLTTATITFNVFSQDLDTVSGARVVVSRYYAENNSEIDVWSRETNSQGQAVGQFETIDAFYTYRVIYENDVKYTSQSEQFNADDSIDIFINTLDTISDVYETISGIPTTLTYTNSTNTTGFFEYTWSSSTAVEACLQVESFIGTSTFRNETCITATGNSIYFNVDAPNGGVFTAKGRIQAETYGAYLVTDTLVHRVDSKPAIEGNPDWDVNAAILALLITIVSVLLYINVSPRLALIVEAAVFLVITVLPFRLLPIQGSNAITAGIAFLFIVLFAVFTMRKD